MGHGQGIPSVLAAADLETDDKIIARLEEHLKKLKEEKKVWLGFVAFFVVVVCLCDSIP